MNDMRTPNGWVIVCFAGKGPATPGTTSFVPLASGRAYVPQEFTLFVVDPERHGAVLRYEIRDGYAQLIEVWSATVEVPTMLAAMRKIGSYEWWKRKAISELLDDMASFDDEVLKRLSDGIGNYDTDDQEWFISMVESHLRSSRESAYREPMRAPRRRVTDERLNHIADLYKEAVATGSRRPTKDVADKLNEGKVGNERLTDSRVAHLVSEARKQGKLPPTERGRPRA